MEKNGKKLYQNAVDLEFADQGMREFGVREALGRIAGDPRRGPFPGLVAGPGTAALPTPWGKAGKIEGRAKGGGGKTAKDLGIDVVAHETDSFTSWESIHQVPGLAPQRLHVEGGARRGRAPSTGKGSTPRSEGRG